MKTVIQILILTFALLLTTAPVAFAGSAMLMERPMDASALDRVRIKPGDVVERKRLTVDWLKKHFKIKDQTIATEILKTNRSFPGQCACPYNRTADGGRCGTASAYTKVGLMGPCYPADVMAIRKLTHVERRP